MDGLLQMYCSDNVFGLPPHVLVRFLVNALVKCAQENQASTQAEKYALQHLIDWLSELHAESQDSAQSHFEESAAAYLQSFKETYSRASFLQVSSSRLLHSL
jgi:hypothetical protein